MIRSKVKEILQPFTKVEPPRQWEKDVSIGKWGGRVTFRYEKDEWKDHLLKMRKNTNVVEVRLILDELILFLIDNIGLEKAEKNEVLKALRECYYCASPNYTGHKNHENAFEYVEKKIEEKRIERYITSIRGIGEDITERLKDRFETLEDLKQASKEELIQIPGMGEKKIRKIKKTEPSI